MRKTEMCLLQRLMVALGVATLATIVLLILIYIRENSDNIRIARATAETCEIQKRSLQQQHYIINTAVGLERLLGLPPTKETIRTTPPKQLIQEAQAVLTIQSNLRGYVALFQEQPLTRVC